MQYKLISKWDKIFEMLWDHWAATDKRTSEKPFANGNLSETSLYKNKQALRIY